MKEYDNLIKLGPYNTVYNNYDQLLSTVINYGTAQDKKILAHIYLCKKCYDLLSIYMSYQKKFGQEKILEMAYKYWLICQTEKPEN